VGHAPTHTLGQSISLSNQLLQVVSVAQEVPVAQAVPEVQVAPVDLVVQVALVVLVLVPHAPVMHLN